MSPENKKKRMSIYNHHHHHHHHHRYFLKWLKQQRHREDCNTGVYCSGAKNKFNIEIKYSLP